MLKKVDRKAEALKGLRALCKKHGVPSDLSFFQIKAWAKSHGLHDVTAAWRGAARWEVRTGANIRMPEKPSILLRRSRRIPNTWDAPKGSLEQCMAILWDSAPRALLLWEAERLRGNVPSDRLLVSAQKPATLAD